VIPVPLTPASSSATEDIILEAVDITKVFPGTVALDHVHFRVHRGKVNALVGENGAGKSTLMNILAGVLQPTEGYILLDGKKITLRSPRDAPPHGIGIVFQELNLFSNLSVTDNIFAGHELRTARTIVDFGAEERITAALLAQLEQDIDPRALIEDLRVGQQQLVEIAKTLAQDVRVLIMDEPTSALSPSETEILFNIIRDLKAKGVSIIYISHKLEELLEISDVITVLRDGRLVAEVPAASIDVNGIIEKMVGRHPTTFYQRSKHAIGNPILKVDALSLPHPILVDRYVLDNVSFALRAGEILGFYGLMGSGRTELLECLMGRHPEATGKVWLNNELLSTHSIGGRIKRGLGLVPEDRQRDGIVQSLPVDVNMTLASLRAYLNRLYLSAPREAAAVKKMIDSLSILVSDPGQLITSLSGGNQQKVIVAKALLTSPRVLMMDEPTRGIDVGAKSEMFRIISDLAARGFGILFVSSELSEVLAMSDRILVMSKGRLTAEFDRAEATEERLVAASATDRVITTP